MEKTKTLLLNKTQIAQRIDRIAYQIYEDNAAGSSELVMIGIHGNGYTLAERLHQKLSEIESYLSHTVHQPSATHRCIRVLKLNLLKEIRVPRTLEHRSLCHSSKRTI